MFPDCGQVRVISDNSMAQSHGESQGTSAPFLSSHEIYGLDLIRYFLFCLLAAS